MTDHKSKVESSSLEVKNQHTPGPLRVAQYSTGLNIEASSGSSSEQAGSGGADSYEELKRQRDAAKAESCEMLLQRLAAERQRDELLKAVTLMYDRWENGPDCYEDPEDYTGFLGKAFKLSLEEENQIIAAIAKAKQGAL